jgi:hypothetical protein
MKISDKDPKWYKELKESCYEYQAQQRSCNLSDKRYWELYNGKEERQRIYDLAKNK